MQQANQRAGESLGYLKRVCDCKQVSGIINASLTEGRCVIGGHVMSFEVEAHRGCSLELQDLQTWIKHTGNGRYIAMYSYTK